MVLAALIPEAEKLPREFLHHSRMTARSPMTSKNVERGKSSSRDGQREMRRSVRPHYRARQVSARRWRWRGAGRIATMASCISVSFFISCFSLTASLLRRPLCEGWLPGFGVVSDKSSSRGNAAPQTWMRSNSCSVKFRGLSRTELSGAVQRG